MSALHETGGAPVIIGGGLAGLMTALAPQPVLLLTGAPRRELMVPPRSPPLNHAVRILATKRSTSPRNVAA
jgi:hypothetical protein